MQGEVHNGGGGEQGVARAEAVREDAARVAAAMVEGEQRGRGRWLVATLEVARAVPAARVAVATAVAGIKKVPVEGMVAAAARVVPKVAEGEKQGSGGEGAGRVVAPVVEATTIRRRCWLAGRATAASPAAAARPRAAATSRATVVIAEAVRVITSSVTVATSTR